MDKKNRDLILATIAIILIGWLVLQHFFQSDQTPIEVTKPRTIQPENMKPKLPEKPS